MKRNESVPARIAVAAILLFIPVLCFADAWTVQDVVGNLFPFNQYCEDGIATDSSGSVFVIVVNDASYDHLSLCWCENGRWRNEKVLSSAGKIKDPCILADSSDTLHILYISYEDYYTGPWRIIHLYGRPGQWSGEYLINDELLNISKINAAFDSNDKLHISFYCYSNDSTYYLTNATGSWQYEVVTTAESNENAIAVAPDDTVYISAMTLSVFENLQIECFSKQAGTWQGEPMQFSNLDEWFSTVSMSSDSSGYLHAATLTTTGGCYNLAYATNLNGSWLSETIDTATEPNFIYLSPKLATDPNDQIHITSTYLSGDSLFYPVDRSASFRHFTGGYGSWQQETIYTDDPANSTGLAWGAVINNQNTLYIAGSLQPEKTLNMFSGNWGNWQNETIAYSGRTGEKSLLMLDLSDQPHIACRDIYHNFIRWVQTDGRTWTTDTNDTIDKTISNSYDWDVCLDNSDNRYIAYVQRDADCYGYATDANGLWETQSWPYTYAPYKPSIAAISPQNVHISAFSCDSFLWNTYVRRFWDDTNMNGNWQTLYVEDTERSLLCVAQKIKADSMSTIHNAYIWTPSYNLYSLFSDAHLKYAKLMPDNTWSVEIVDPNISIGVIAQPDIDFADNSNAAHISYYHDKQHAVKYATNASGSWVLETVPSNGLLSSDTAIAVDSIGLPHIALVEDEVLKIARYTDNSCTQWEFEIIEEDVDAENPMPSLEIDNNDDYHISFYKEAEKKILYATTAINTPVISVDPENITYHAPKDSNSPVQLTIRNNGSAILNISGTTFIGPDAGKFSHSGFSSSLPPGGVCLTAVTVDTSQTGSFDAELQIHSDDPRNPTITIPLHAFVFDLSASYLECKISLVDFNEVELGHTSDVRTLRFTNTYNGPMTIYGMSVGPVDPDNFPTSKLPPTPFTIAKDAHLDIDVSFSPQFLGTIEGTLTIAVNPGEDAQVALTGVGIPLRVPNLAVAADSFDLEAILPGGSDKTYISLQNVGDADLEISQWDVSNITEFTTDPNHGFNPLGITMPLTLTPGEKRSMMMSFNTTIPGQYSNNLDITSNDPDCKHTVVTFTGNASVWNKCDFDIDGDVDFEDFAILAKDWIAKPDTNPYPADIMPEEPDGVVNMLDLEYFFTQWLFTKTIF